MVFLSPISEEKLIPMNMLARNLNNRELDILQHRMITLLTFSNYMNKKDITVYNTFITANDISSVLKVAKERFPLFRQCIKAFCFYFVRIFQKAQKGCEVGNLTLPFAYTNIKAAQQTAEVNLQLYI